MLLVYAADIAPLQAAMEMMVRMVMMLYRLGVLLRLYHRFLRVYYTCPSRLVTEQVAQVARVAQVEHQVLMPFTVTCALHLSAIGTVVSVAQVVMEARAARVEMAAALHLVCIRMVVQELSITLL